MSVQSGVCTNNGHGVQSQVVGEEAAEGLMQSVGVSTWQELVGMDVRKLQAWPHPDSKDRCMAFVDGHLNTDLPFNLLMKGFGHISRAIVGANSMDSTDGATVDWIDNQVREKIITVLVQHMEPQHMKNEKRTSTKRLWGVRETCSTAHFSSV
jgi:hypothetical protein